MNDDITVKGLVVDVVCAAMGIALLNICFLNIVNAIWVLALKIG